ncbi:MAG: class I SAM-dependent methyltransferase [Chloroflexi bacterium]|nr:class I SAM-dependent methyltransferase [Chloroflexota bacterium]
MTRSSPERLPEFETVGCLFSHAAPAELLFERPDWWFELPGNFAWRRCPECGLLLLSPRPTQTKIIDYYLSNYAAYRPAIADEKWPLMRWKRRRNLRGVMSAVNQHAAVGQLLDVGCATGNYLAEMQKGGWEVQGVELQSDAAVYAQQRFGFTVFNGDLLDSQLPAQSFDVVTLWDVLEHTFDPLAILKETARILRPGGLVAFSIPDPTSVWAERFGPTWIGYDAPRHLYLFHGQSLDLLLNRAGFHLVVANHYLATYHTWAASFHTWLNQKMPPGTTRKFMRKMTYLPFWAPLTNPYFNWLNRRGRGSVLTVVAKLGTEL